MWPWIALFLISYAVVYATRPKISAPKPSGLGEFDLPTAEVGREIPVLFGTRDLNGPNVVWYGDLASSAIKKKGGKK